MLTPGDRKFVKKLFVSNKFAFSSWNKIQTRRGSYILLPESESLPKTWQVYQISDGLLVPKKSYNVLKMAISSISRFQNS